MAGCWRGPSGGAVVEEHYTPPAANLMLGVSRYTKAGGVISYEFNTIAWGDSAWCSPRGPRAGAGRFRLLGSPRAGAVWENPAHDFPTGIAYRRVPGDTLVGADRGARAGMARRSRSGGWRVLRGMK